MFVVLLIRLFSKDIFIQILSSTYSFYIFCSNKKAKLCIIDSTTKVTKNFLFFYVFQGFIPERRFSYIISLLTFILLDNIKVLFLRLYGLYINL